MAKNRKQSKAPNTDTKTARVSETNVSSSAAPTPESVIAAADAAGLSPLAVDEVPKPLDSEVPRKHHGLLLAAEKQKADLDAQEMAAPKTSEKLDAERKAFEGQRSELSASRAELKAHKAALDAQEKGFEPREKDLLEREEVLAALAAEADAGFLARRRQILTSTEEERKRIVDDIESRGKSEMKAALDRMTDVSKREEDILRQVRERVETLEKSISEREDALQAKEKGLGRKEQLLKLDKVDLEESKSDIENLVAKRAAERVVSAEASTTRLTERCSALEAQLEECQRAAQLLSYESPERTLARLTGLQNDVARLNAELASRPTTAEMQELESLRETRSRLQDENYDLHRKIGENERRLDTHRIDVNKVEMLRDTLLAKEKHIQLLQGAIDELRADIDTRLEQAGKKPVFPAMTMMDTNKALNQQYFHFWESDAGDSKDWDLGAFAKDLQYRIAESGSHEPSLYFELNDIRALLGGLAMSQMHLYQGISGIGKSSLPRRFARAVGGLCETISVQAGWRDKQDLFGYFNAFDKTYHETEFVKALYMAQLPEWKDRLFIILLDEMNLSHPEQYGADILDVLERTALSERRFTLLSSDDGKRTLPKLLENGALRLPPNVWFVGTANHDETTKDFADKTYDRSFVLALPDSYPKFELKKVAERPPINVMRLKSAFALAVEKHKELANNALRWMEEKLRPVLVDEFGISWGGRLEAQAKLFIPVFVAAGGDAHTALDQMLATRVLRRIRGRHELTEENFAVLKTVLERDWLDMKQPPKLALSIVATEAKRLGYPL